MKRLRARNKLVSADKRGPDSGSGNDSRPPPERWTNFAIATEENGWDSLIRSIKERREVGNI